MVVSENAQRVLEKRYLVKDENGNPVETVDELFHRVAHAIAQSDKRYAPDADLGETEEIFYRMMTELEFLPNSPTLITPGVRSGSFPPALSFQLRTAWRIFLRRLSRRH
jgi:ribonucleoside-diphosphate reductase alpha chain